MPDRFDETTTRMGKTLGVFCGHTMRRLLLIASAIASLGIVGVLYDMVEFGSPKRATLAGSVLLLMAGLFVAWRWKTAGRGVTVCRHGLRVTEQIREIEYMWDEISHIEVNRIDKNVAVILIDGKSLDYNPAFWQSIVRKPDEFVSLVRKFIPDVRNR